MRIPPLRFVPNLRTALPLAPRPQRRLLPRSPPVRPPDRLEAHPLPREGFLILDNDPARDLARVIKEFDRLVNDMSGIGTPTEAWARLRGNRPADHVRGK